VVRRMPHLHPRFLLFLPCRGSLALSSPITSETISRLNTILSLKSFLHLLNHVATHHLPSHALL
jgi:hypothetical protein